MVPDDWKLGLICPIFKKINYSVDRRITLLSVVYKIFSSILRSRLSTCAEEILSKNDIHRGRGTSDQIFKRQSVEKYYNSGVDMIINRFPTVIKRMKMLDTLEIIGVLKKLIRLVVMTLERISSQGFVGGKISRNFEMSTGVRQGDSLPTALFNLILNEILEELGFG